MSLQLACNLTEGKSFGGRRTFANEKAILMSTLVRLIGSLRANLDKKMIAQAVSDYGSLKEEFKDALFGILGSYQRGEITNEVMEEMWHSEIRSAWEKAYGLGIKSVGNPFGIWEQDKTWLKGAEAEEFGYLGRFVEDIKNNEFVMELEDRLSMYIETLDGVYFHGQVEGSPDYVRIVWHLRDAKHCDSCIRAAAGSPYTKKNLPFVPKDGTTECLSNCRCFLTFEYADEKPKPELYMIKGLVKPTVPKGYRLPSDNERDKLGQMSSEIHRLRGMISATSGDQKKEFIRMRRDLNADMIDFMEKHKIYYVPGGQTQKVKFVESTADEVMKELILEGGPGSGNFGHKGRPGMRGGSLGSGASSGIFARVAGGGGKGKDYPVHSGKPDDAVEITNKRAIKETGGMYLAKRMAHEILIEGGPGSGFFGHKGRPGHRGGSLPVGRVAPHGVGDWAVRRKVMVSASMSEKSNLYKALSLVPDKHFKKSGIKAITVMNSQKEVNKLYFLRSGDKSQKGFECDAFYDHNSGEMVLSPGSSQATILHEFAHSIRGAGMWKKKVWDSNASTGSVSNYGKTDMEEGFAEAYAHHVLVGNFLKSKAPGVAAVMKEFFEK
jgi:hypothetical protein